MILELIARLKAEGKLSMIMILHNYVHVLESCDRVNMIVDGVIALDKPTAETSVEELTEIVVDEYRRARLTAQAEEAARAARRAGQGRSPPTMRRVPCWLARLEHPARLGVGGALLLGDLGPAQPERGDRLDDHPAASARISGLRSAGITYHGAHGGRGGA